MPSDNIKRAIQKGTGELPGVTYDEVNYEGYGPGGVAILLETMTDNKMRTTPEIRHLFSKHGGNLSEPNSVAWMFEKKGQWVIPRSEVDEERLLELVLEAGAEDLNQVDDRFEVTGPPPAFPEIQRALEQAEIKPSEAALVYEPSNTVELTGKKAEQCLRLLEILEDHDDVQNVYANLDVVEEEASSGGSS